MGNKNKLINKINSPQNVLRAEHGEPSFQERRVHRLDELIGVVKHGLVLWVVRLEPVRASLPPVLRLARLEGGDKEIDEFIKPCE